MLVPPPKNRQKWIWSGYSLFVFDVLFSAPSPTRFLAILPPPRKQLRYAADAMTSEVECERSLKMSRFTEFADTRTVAQRRVAISAGYEYRRRRPLLLSLVFSILAALVN